MLDLQQISIRPLESSGRSRSVGSLVLTATLSLACAGCPDGSEGSTSATAGDSDSDSGPPSTGITAGGPDPSGGESDPTDTDTDTGSGTDTDTGTNTDTGGDPPECGDGQLDAGEECDQGEANHDEAACLSNCTLAECGDGHLQEGIEECDQGTDNADDAACTLDCTKARCGDKKIQKGVEACDWGDNPEDAPMVNDDTAYGGCTTICEWGPRCGDNEVQGEEECDDGEEPDPAICSKECTLLKRVIFVTSVRYFGDLGGLAGADAKCQTLATDAGLYKPETFRAWLSTGQASPSGWDVDPEMRYQLPSGMVVADDWADLLDGQLKLAINQNEDGVMLDKGASASVWTGTFPDGSPTEMTCADWNSADSKLGGKIGLSTDSNDKWTTIADKKCSSLARLYCIAVW